MGLSLRRQGRTPALQGSSKIDHRPQGRSLPQPCRRIATVRRFRQRHHTVQRIPVGGLPAPSDIARERRCQFRKGHGKKPGAGEKQGCDLSAGLVRTCVGRLAWDDSMLRRSGDFSLAPLLWGEGWGEGLLPRTQKHNVCGDSPSPGSHRTMRSLSSGAHSRDPLASLRDPTSPREERRAVPGMIHYAAAHARQIRREPDTFWLSRLRKGPGMQYVNSIFGELLKPIDRRQFREIVERHDGNAYDKTFKSWDHLVTMVGAQLGRVTSLRGVEATVKANSHQHYHLGVSKAPRATLSRANARRPVGVFAETFAMLAKKADRHTRAEGAEMVRLIDSSPVPLGKMCEWAKWNGRIRGMKMHVVYHPGNDVPRCVEITPATVNDVEIGRQTELEAGATYVFDKGYYHFGWWKKINAANAFLVTRVKVNTRLRKTKSRYVRKTIGDGFRIIADADVMLASKGDSKLPIPLRRIKVKRDKGGTITLITNDLERTAVEIAALYKRRWQMELLFRWIKQHLNLGKFMGRNDNAIRLQIIAAMIAYLLLRLARRLNSLKMLDLRLAELVCQRLFMRKSIAEIDTPPPVNPSKPKPKFSPDQLGFNYV